MFNLLPFLFNKKSFLKNASNSDESNEYIIIKKDFDNNECIICLDAMLINDKVRILECSHMYHYECINKWIEKKKQINCPICSK
jgi:hypothetical protein|tara:strand:+ start:137 stop:388 length:252 start_codon:yes stop_codon:yes gene_type:complete